MAAQLTVLNAELLYLAQLLKISDQLRDDLRFVDKPFRIEEVKNGQAMHLCILIGYLK